MQFICYSWPKSTKVKVARQILIHTSNAKFIPNPFSSFEDIKYGGTKTTSLCALISCPVYKPLQAAQVLSVRGATGYKGSNSAQTQTQQYMKRLNTRKVKCLNADKEARNTWSCAPKEQTGYELPSDTPGSSHGGVTQHRDWVILRRMPGNHFVTRHERLLPVPFRSPAHYHALISFNDK
jgi:hypothetical protein